MITNITATHSTPAIRQQWTLTQVAFDSLLSKLNADREVAGRAYEELRDRLTRFFQPHAPLHSEHWADVVLDRVARKSQEMDIANINAFVWGVARIVRSEMFRANRREIAVDEPVEVPQIVNAEEDIDRARKFDWLARLVTRMPRGEFELVLGWYTCYEKAAQRQQLALSLGVSVASLRVRAHRARLRLRRMAVQEGLAR